MRQGPRDINLTNVELLAPSTPWTWNSQNLPPRPPGYVLWFVFSGTLVAETHLQRWEIPAAHVLYLPNNREMVQLLSDSPDLMVGTLHYEEIKPGPRLINRCIKIENQNFIESLMKKMRERFDQDHMWEANTLLDVVLDEIQLGAILPAAVRTSVDSRFAHQATQARLKGIDWSNTQRLLAPPTPRR